MNSSPILLSRTTFCNDDAAICIIYLLPFTVLPFDVLLIIPYLMLVVLAPNFEEWRLLLFLSFLFPLTPCPSPSFPLKNDTAFRCP